MDTKIAFSWFIIIIMVASTLAFVAVPAFQETPPEEPPAEQPEAPEQTTPVKMTSDAVDASVAEILPAMLLTAGTKEPSISKIDSEVYSAGNIRGISSYYRASGTEAISLTYVAEISYTTSTSFEELLQKITANSSLLEGITAYPVGLVQAGPVILLNNPDLNLSRDFSFESDNFQCYLNPGTLREDSIKAVISAEISGDTASNIFCYESSNITGEKTESSILSKAQISELLPEASISGYLPYSASFSEDSLKQELLAVSGVQAASLSVQPAQRLIFLQIDKNISSSLQDFNAFLSTLDGFNVLASNEAAGKFFLVAEFSQQTDYSALKEKIMQKLSEFGVKNEEISLEDPKIYFEADLNLSSANTSALKNDLNALLGSKNFDGLYYQLALFDFNSLKDPDSNKEFSLQEKLEAKIFMAHSPQDFVELSISFTAQRGKVVQFLAAEQK